MPEHAKLITEHPDVKHKDFQSWINIGIFNWFIPVSFCLIYTRVSLNMHTQSTFFMIESLCISECSNVTAVSVVITMTS